MPKQRILKVIGPRDTIARLRDVGLFPGQTVQVMRDGVWKINGSFTIALRLTNAKIVLE